MNRFALIGSLPVQPNPLLPNNVRKLGGFYPLSTVLCNDSVPNGFQGSTCSLAHSRLKSERDEVEHKY
jgi:hypothetical protein